jgi:hydroxymethylbilane synthase
MSMKEGGWDDDKDKDEDKDFLMRSVLRLGARGSLLSRRQSEGVARAVEEVCAGVRVEVVPVVTSGDVIGDRPLHEFGGKGLFTKELEVALLRGEVDFAVHSFKDVPVTMPLVETSELVIAATPTREDPRDVLVTLEGCGLMELKPGARVGTGSLRRAVHVLELGPVLRVEGIRGNVDTRLRKLRDGEFDAGTMRAMDELLPAAGQGALALECRREDGELREILGRLNDAASALAVRMERGVVLGLNGDCHSPIAAYATVGGEGTVTLKAAVGGRDGVPPVVRAERSRRVEEWERVVAEVVEALKGKGAMGMLGGCGVVRGLEEFATN